MTFRILQCASGLAGLLALCVPLCLSAGPTGYTDVTSFDSAVSSGFQALTAANFEDIPSGTLIPNGTNVGGGVTLSYTPLFSNFEMDVVSGLDTTSAPNYLGSTTTGGPTSEFDAFITGDQVTLTFAHPEQAVGLFVIDDSSNSDEAGAYTLAAAGGTVSNTTSTDTTFGTLADGGNVFFLGLVETDPTMAFTGATFSSDASFGVPFNLDDLVTTSATAATGKVPDESPTLCLVLGAGAALLALRRRWHA
jgi:hypothetical protein